MKRAVTLLSATALLLVGCLFVTASYAKGGKGGTVHERSFVHNDSRRSYLLYVPAAYDGQEAWPLVIDYHGYNVDGAFQKSVDRMDVAADAARFLIAYPDGLIVDDPFDGPGSGWNFDGLIAQHDDVDFTSKLIDHVMEDFMVDPARVHATGWSMGSQMIWGVACRLSDRIASVGGVSGPMDDAFIQTCDAGRPYSVLLMHGTADIFWPPEGVEVNGYVFANPRKTPAFWARQNNCSSDPVVTKLKDRDKNDNSTVTLFEYPSCDSDAEVLYYRINDGGHTWPGGSWPGGDPVPEFLGPVNRDINASAEILNFFTRNPHPSLSKH
jgi:polyhydroxybutyrate depolymerase